MATEKKEKKKQPRYVVLSGIAIQMGITIYLGAELGSYIDEKYFPNKKLFLIICTLLAVVIAFYVLLKQVNKLNDKDDAEKR